MSDLSHMLGDVFKAASGKTGLFQQEVGRAAGVDNRAVLHIENHRGNPMFSNLYSLVRFYKMDPRVLSLQQESPAVSQLIALISDCTEAEAARLYPILQSAIDMLRYNNPSEVKKRRRACSRSSGSRLCVFA